MNILYVSISGYSHMDQHSIFLDLLHEFKRNGHSVFVVCSLGNRKGSRTNLSVENNYNVLRVKTGNNATSNLVKKGLTAVNLPKQYIAAIKQYFSDVTFDLVLYPTPPITHVDTVKYIKQRDHAKTYLLLKDIFPQNAVDLGMMSKKGLKSIINALVKDFNAVGAHFHPPGVNFRILFQYIVHIGLRHTADPVRYCVQLFFFVSEITVDNTL